MEEEEAVVVEVDGEEEAADTTADERRSSAVDEGGSLEMDEEDRVGGNVAAEEEAKEEVEVRNPEDEATDVEGEEEAETVDDGITVGDENAETIATCKSTASNRAWRRTLRVMATRADKRA